MIGKSHVQENVFTTIHAPETRTDTERKITMEDLVTRIKKRVENKLKGARGEAKYEYRENGVDFAQFANGKVAAYEKVLKIIEEERQQKKEEIMKKVDAKEIDFVELMDNVLVIANKEIVPFEWSEETPELGGFVTLEDIQKQLEDKYSSFIVIQESPLSGKIYRFNNYGKKVWYEVGNMCGYA